MTLTGEQLMTGFSKFIGDLYVSTTTSAGNAGGTTLVDTGLGRFGDSARRDWWFRITQDADTSENEERKANETLETGTVTVSPAYSAQIGSGVAYEMHRYEPLTKWRALNQARYRAIDELFVEVHYDLYTSDGVQTEYDIPTNIEKGPYFMQVEMPFNPKSSRNFLSDAQHEDSTASTWTVGAQFAATDYDRIPQDQLIPKRGNTDVRLDFTTGADGTYAQTVANMNSNITATLVAGRKCVGMMWVYATTAGPVVEILTDAGTLATGTAHSGSGWELLTVEGTPADDNATTFTFQLRKPDAASDEILFVHNSWLSFAQEVPRIFHHEHAVEVDIDNSNEKVYLPAAPERGLNFRLIGKNFLTDLGESTPWSGTMEVDEFRAQLLYVYAAEELFGHELLNTPAFVDVANRITIIRQKLTEYQMKFPYKSHDGRAIGPWTGKTLNHRGTRIDARWR